MKDLEGEDGAQEDFGKGADEEFVPGHLPFCEQRLGERSVDEERKMVSFSGRLRRLGRH